MQPVRTVLFMLVCPLGLKKLIDFPILLIQNMLMYLIPILEKRRHMRLDFLQGGGNEKLIIRSHVFSICHEFTTRIVKPQFSNECTYTDATTSVDGVHTQESHAVNANSAGTTSNVRSVSSGCGKRKMHPEVDSRGSQMESQSALHNLSPPSSIDCTDADIAICVDANHGLYRQSGQSISVDTQNLGELNASWSQYKRKRSQACGTGRNVRRRNVAPVAASVAYAYLGDCNQRCRHCGAMFWYEEHLKGHSSRGRVEYQLFCGGGRIFMEPEPDPPESIKQLLGDKHFMENMRAYNHMFAMTSFGAKIDKSINTGRGPYVFKVSGQVYHWIGSLCPSPGDLPRFLQLYIYDTENEVENRMRHFGGLDSSTLDREVVQGLLQFLDAHNELVQLFRTARDKCSEIDVPEFKIRLYNAEGAREVIQRHLKGDRDGFEVGGRILLPSSFTRGPWYMAQYPELTASDRADFVCRVFEQKIKALIAFLKQEPPFGYVKRGQCYTGQHELERH
nr:helitron helicase-like domain-containing protein [Tanacetum cinerariifolium]